MQVTPVPAEITNLQIGSLQIAPSTTLVVNMLRTIYDPVGTRLVAKSQQTVSWEFGDWLLTNQYASLVSGEWPAKSNARTLSADETVATQALVAGPGTSWANLPAPSDFQGLLFVNDVGINGSIWRSNGTVWSLVGGSCVLGQSAVAVSCTTTTNEEVLQSVNLPAGVLGVNGALRLSTLWTCTGAVGTKTLRARIGATALGGSAWLALVRAASAAECLALIPQVIRNRNVANSQVVYAPANGATTTQSSAVSTFTEDTSVATVVGITGQKATAGEVLTLEGYTLELLR